ncbi:MAG TPA: hypothetical protein VFC02_22975 [Anaerolineales bacterium]|nr:hypothetical protein [Anaerolineales bacterium]
MFYRIARIIDFLALTLAMIIAAGGDTPRLTGESDRVRFFTREIEFDYPNWVWDATWTKIEQSTINAPYVFDRGTNKQIVFDYLRVTQQLIQTEGSIEQIFADPNVANKESASAFLRGQRDELIVRQNSLAPFAESTLQAQISTALADLGLTTGGQPLPSVLYHVSSTPLALIVAPRNHIEQIANISVLPTLTLDQQIKLEDEVAHGLNVSTLVVGIGGVGVYPTMVTETTDLRWMLETIAHEWTHNYLNIRPLGLNYSTTPELRTMNETTASIAGNEVGSYVIQEYYPEMLASTPRSGLISFHQSDFLSNRLDDPAPFDFRAEMHETRVTADEMLAEGKIEEAEAYMEARRQVFWENGYLLRKLNQAYFAFHGAYADVPGGAAGEDPVGPAVRALREQSSSLEEFINTIAWMSSFEELKQAIK